MRRGEITFIKSWWTCSFLSSNDNLGHFFITGQERTSSSWFYESYLTSAHGFTLLFHNKLMALPVLFIFAHKVFFWTAKLKVSWKKNSKNDKKWRSDAKKKSHIYPFSLQDSRFILRGWMSSTAPIIFAVQFFKNKEPEQFY